MVTLRDLLAGFALPLVLSAVLLIVAWRATKRKLGARESRSCYTPLAIGVGYFAGWWALLERPPFPPIDSTGWLFYLAIPLSALGFVHAWLRWPLVSYMSALVMVPLTVWLLARPLLKPDTFDPQTLAIGVRWPFEWTLFEMPAPAGVSLWVPFLASVLGIAWVWAMEPLAARMSQRRTAGLLFLAIAPAGLVVILSASKLLGQVGGLLAATLAGIVAATLIFGRAGVARGTMLFYGTLLGGVLLSGNLFANLWTSNALLLYLAPLLAWIPEPFELRLGRTNTALLQALLILLPVGMALVHAGLEFRAHMAEF